MSSVFVDVWVSGGDAAPRVIPISREQWFEVVDGVEKALSTPAIRSISEILDVGFEIARLSGIQEPKVAIYYPIEPRQLDEGEK